MSDLCQLHEAGAREPEHTCWKAVEVQSYDPKVSLLHYIVMYLEKERPETRRWVDEIPSLARAGKGLDCSDCSMCAAGHIRI